MLIMVRTVSTAGIVNSYSEERRSKAYADELVDNLRANPLLSSFEVKVWNTRASAGLVKVDGKLVPTEGPDYTAVMTFEERFREGARR